MEDQTARSRASQGPARASPVLPQQQRRFDGESSPSNTPRHNLTATSESWVEVSSQPSSSSLSSIGDEIVTTGLQVGGQYGRRRRMPASARSLTQQQTAMYVGASSQDDDASSDSEDDRRLASSAENIPSTQGDADESDGDSSDDGDDATALGGRVADRPVFRPQPNAFTHAPSQPQRSYSTNAAMPPHPHSGFTRPSFSQRSQTRVHRGGPSFMSPSAREDHDAALRASLTTLLSCAAAARGLPKSKEEAEAQAMARNGVGPSDQPMSLGLVPESELMGQRPAPSPATASSSPRKRSSPTRSRSRADGSSSKAQRSSSSGRGTAKKKKTAQAIEGETYISPTLLTWVVSAGVVVLVSVVGFGAGYVIGREVGRQEAMSVSAGSINETTSCGREAIRSSSGTLRRFKWSTVGKSIVA